MATLVTTDALIDLTLTPTRRRANIRPAQGADTSVTNQRTTKTLLAFTKYATHFSGGAHKNLKINFNPTGPGSLLIFDKTSVNGATVKTKQSKLVASTPLPSNQCDLNLGAAIH